MDTKASRWRLDGKLARRYRFPPLQSEAAPGSTAESGWQDYQQAFDQGYDEGVQEGRSAGYEAGAQEGRAAGHAAGFHQGKLEGQQAGRSSIDAQLNEMIVPLGALKELLEEGHSRQVQEQQTLILDLVRRVSQQVIRCELTLQPQQILKLVEETLSALPDDQADIKIHLEPTAVLKLKELAEDKIRGWNLVADAAISAGSCRIVSDKSDADASVETRLDACMQQVAAKLNEAELES
ncbi:flagellar assembly protein FliH [Shewanella salipaludis]|uniref:Flagellar assembly protein FliH n=1 Tax=Shewanella salipaludis TaxID=2723052 RepID=A0A972JMQ2_9GAMM|nr:flagellar assembly protein FliH [Shewanella salipaludis]NMH66742.1 flagellar assembly protein H [Shewanella salipaludis]